MTRLATLTATQDFTTSSAAGRALVTDAVQVQADVLVLDSPPGHLEVNQDFDGTATLIQPSLQLVGAAPGTNVDFPAVVPSWTVDGADPGAILQGDLQVGADLDACARTWERPVIASTGTRREGDHTEGPLGYEITRGGPPPGPSIPVSFDLELRGTGSMLGTNSTMRLLTSGYREKTSRTWDSKGHVMTIQGSGPEVLYRDVEVDLDFPPNHGNTQGQIAIMLMQAAGIPDALNGVDPMLGAPRTNPVHFACKGLFAALHEVLRPIGYVVMASREDGVFRAVTIDVTDDDLVMMEITEVDVEHKGKVDSDGTEPTCIEVTGHRLADTGTGTSSGAVTSTVTVSTYTDGYQLPLAVASQSSSGGTITATGVSLGAAKDNVLTARTSVAVTTVDGCVEGKKTTTWGFFKPPAARYIPAAAVDGEPRLYHDVFFFDSVPVADDAAEGFAWDRPRFVVTSEVFERPQWRADGRRIGTITSHNGWRNIAAAIKNRTGPGSAWDAELYDPTISLSAGFDGVLFDAERYFVGTGAPDDSYPTAVVGGKTVVLRHTQVDVETRVVDECDYQPETSTATTVYGLRTGSTQLYAGGAESRDDSEVGVTSTTTNLNIVASGRVTSVASGTDAAGRSIPTVVTDGGQGGIPGAEICTAETIDRASEQTFSVTVCLTRPDADGNPVEDTRKPETLDSVFVQTAAEAQAFGARELRIIHSYELALEMVSPVPILDAGHTVSVNLPELGFTAKKCKVLDPETTIEGGSGGRVAQKLTLRVPPV